MKDWTLLRDGDAALPPRSTADDIYIFVLETKENVFFNLEGYEDMAMFKKDDLGTVVSLVSDNYFAQVGFYEALRAIWSGEDIAMRVANKKAFNDNIAFVAKESGWGDRAVPIHVEPFIKESSAREGRKSMPLLNEQIMTKLTVLGCNDNEKEITLIATTYPDGSKAIRATTLVNDAEFGVYEEDYATVTVNLSAYGVELGDDVVVLNHDLSKDEQQRVVEAIGTGNYMPVEYGIAKSIAIQLADTSYWQEESVLTDKTTTAARIAATHVDADKLNSTKGALLCEKRKGAERGR